MFNVIETEVYDSVGPPLDCDGRSWFHTTRRFHGKVSGVGIRIDSGRHQNHLGWMRLIAPLKDLK